MAKIFGTGDSEVYEGTAVEDLFFASEGNDTLNGWQGNDTAIYDAGPFSGGVAINNTPFAVDGLAPFTVDKRGWGVDTLNAVESFHGSNGDDLIHLGAYAVYVLDRAGNDLVVVAQVPGARPVFVGAGSGDDRYVGSPEHGDIVDYEAIFGNDLGGVGAGGAIVELANETARDPWGGLDTLVGIEHVWGSPQADDIAGDDADNWLRGQKGDDLLRGGAGNDELEGGAGNDTLDGGAGDRDVADYSRDPAGISADLAAGLVRDGWGDTDTLLGVEILRATPHDDVLTGSAGNERLGGEAGNDVLAGGEGDDTLSGGSGDDTLDGGGGGDRVVFGGARSGVEVDLAAGWASDGLGGIDTLIGIEEARGTPHADEIRGADGVSSVLDGADGNDRLWGGHGDAGVKNDLLGGAGNDTLTGGDGTLNFFEPGLGHDIVDGGDGAYGELSYYFDHRPDEGWGGIRAAFSGPREGRVVGPDGREDRFAGIDMVRGTGLADAFFGGPGQETFRGMAGRDTLDGGGGAADQADYSGETAETGAVAGIVADLAAGAIVDAYGDLDTVAGIERVLGTAFADRMTGSARADTLEGAEGNDTLEGGGGDDFLRGGAGDDSAVYGGPAGAHALTLYGGKTTIDVRDIRDGGTGYDGLEGIETLVFQGGVPFGDRHLDLAQLTGAVSLGTGPMMRLVEMYVAFFDRAPDALGLLYWGTRLADGMSLAQIAASFFEQDETLVGFPKDGPSGALVDAAYDNLLERDPDAAGRAFWVDQLDSGAVARGVFMLSLIDGARGPEAAPEDLAVIEAKAGIGWRYAVEYGLTDPARGGEAMAAYDPGAPERSADRAEGLMAEFRDAAMSPGSDELIVRIGSFGADPLEL